MRRVASAAALTACLATPAAAQKEVPENSVWKYHATGEDLLTAWREPDYADTGWASGPGSLGYGETWIETTVPYGPDPAAKYITTYFRIAFTPLADLAEINAMTLNALHDDGFVAYLNGHEVARRSMPAGEVTWQTPALLHEATGYAAVDISGSIGWLVPGSNALAVEVHQADPTSSDLVWDVSLACITGPPEVTRGPYLQSVGPASAIVRWRTDRFADSQVLYMVEGGSVWSSIVDSIPVLDHEVAIGGLSPGTRYLYAIGTSEDVLAGGDPDHSFVTTPLGTSGAVRLWAIGDAGTADASAAAVRDAYLAYAAGHPADLWLTLGDNAYIAGTDTQFQAGFFDMYESLLRGTAVWPTRGNHDVLYAAPTLDYYDHFSLPENGEAGGVPSGTEAYYSMDFREVHVIGLDSEGSSRSPGGAMLTWLAADLAATDREWVIAYWHHAPYSEGSHDSDDPLESEGEMADMRANVLPVLETGGVDLVLTGHSHSYERSYLLDGHYGVSSTLDPSMIVNRGDGRDGGDGPYRKPPGRVPHAGAVYVVAGTAGQPHGGPLDHPAMVTAVNELGSVVIDVDAHRLDLRFVDAAGVVRDSFAIVKNLPLDVPVAGTAGAPGLEPPRPNPFTASTRMAFTLARAGDARLAVLDVTGREVRTLARGGMPAGTHSVVWDGRDGAGAPVPAGVYFAVLDADGRRATRRMVRVD